MINIKVLLRTTLFEGYIEVKESYQTIKKRLLDNQDFVEITRMQGTKSLFNKSVIGELTVSEAMGRTKKRKK